MNYPVQTTFAASGNPWAAYIHMQAPKRNGSKLLIDTSKIALFDAENRPVNLGKITAYRDIFGKMKPGFTLHCDPKDHRTVSHAMRDWRINQPEFMWTRKFVRRGVMGVDA